MGEVYQARDTTLARAVALKVLPEAFTSAAKVRVWKSVRLSSHRPALLRQESIVSYRLWRLAAGTLLSIGLLWLAARGVSWAEVAAGLGSARWSLIAIAAGCVLVATALRAWCWRRLLIATTIPVTWPAST